MSVIRLNEKNLSKIPESVAVPGYDRSVIHTGIVHVGVGNFHRAHQAVYTEQLLSQGHHDWGICGICLLERDLKMFETLTEQDGLYTLVVKEPDGSQAVRVIGSVLEVLYAPEDPSVVISRMADPGTRIISLTITEGGYNYDSSSGEFLFSDPGVQWDLRNPDRPRTIFGYLTEAILLRKNRGLSGFTLLSCDNIQQNGEVSKKMLMSFVGKGKPELVSWIEDHVTFPNCMVDRITPVTSEKDVEELQSAHQIQDGWPVVCEPYTQWIVEDHFSQGRPAWEYAGVQFVKEVEPYEKMKIRLLNAGHSLLGFTGTLYGYLTIDETVRNPDIEALLSKFMDVEVTPVLGKIEGIDLDTYKNDLITRFSNPYISDRLSRICSESSSKIPKFLLPTIREQLETGGAIEVGALIIAAWCRYLELAWTEGLSEDLQDANRDVLIKAAMASQEEDPLAFIGLVPVFGKLAHSERFVKVYLAMIQSLRNKGIEQVIKSII